MLAHPMALSVSVRAEPRMSLMDDTCPTLMVLRELERQQNPRGRTVHDANNAHRTICDCRGGVKQKLYFQCLLDLPARLPLTSSIPSYASQNFYKCLLAGKRAEPGMKSEAYDNVLMDSEPGMTSEAAGNALML